jgi:GT2 family glycosyltransferase
VFADRKVIAATGPILPLEKTSRRMNLGFKFVSILFVKASILIGRPSVVGSNFAVRSSSFRKVGGFNEKFLTYEDYDLSLRLRRQGEIRYLDDAVVHASIRRVKAWGIFGYFSYHMGNIIRYSLVKKPKETYEPIR